MTAVDRVKKICKERKIPISKLESDLGFGNAYISGLKKGVFPNDRLISISEYLNLSAEYIATGKEQKDEFTEYQEQGELWVKIRNDKRMLNALEKFYKLSDRQKEHVFELIDLLEEVSE